MKHNLSLLEVKHCIKYDLQFGERILVSSDLEENFQQPTFLGIVTLADMDWTSRTIISVMIPQ